MNLHSQERWAGRGSPGEAGHRWRGRQGVQPRRLFADRAAVARLGLASLELLLIGAWTLVVTWPYLNLDPAVVPAGREFLAVIQIHHIWTQARECGWCALWYGNVAGGYPAFVDPNGSALHPLVILATLGWGVLNGSKLVLVGAFLMAGLAQWWLGRVLCVGRVARVWSAGMAVAGGHLAARMELGALPLIVSTAACAMVLPPLIALSRTGRHRAAVLVGLALALAAVAGNGYLQVGLAFSLPAALLLVPWERERAALLARRFAFAAALALLLAAPFLVPFLHFLPEFGKAHDPAFPGAQPFADVALNLVIRDHAFYVVDPPHELPYPYPSHYVLYIGWIPVLLALGGWCGARDAHARRAIAFLTLFALLAFWVASAAPQAWLARALPYPGFVQLISGVRYPSFMAGLAVAPMLGLAAIGLDLLLGAAWSQRRAAVRPFSPDARWLLAIPLVLALLDARAFGSPWITTFRLDPGVAHLLEALRTPDLQWVNVPRGQHIYVEPAVRMRLKLAYDFYLTWYWKDRQPPRPLLEANVRRVPSRMIERTIMDGLPVYVPPNPAFYGFRPRQRAMMDGVPIYVAPAGREYAAVAHAGGSRTICSARGTGGNIDVDCDLSRPGALIVIENRWFGWHARVNGQPVPLKPGRWLTVELPAGRSTAEFRYRPWDVPLGLALSLVGVALAAYAWLRGPGVTAADRGSAQGIGDRPSA